MAGLDLRSRRLDTVDAPNGDCIVYVMARDQRITGNHALDQAQHYALEYDLPLAVVFCLKVISTTVAREHYEFMLDGLKEVEAELIKKNIPFIFLIDTNGVVLSKYLRSVRPQAIFFDFSPLRGSILLHQSIARHHPTTAVFEVDTHNSVPVWSAYPKQAVGARVLRPRIHSMIADYIEVPSTPHTHPYLWEGENFSIDNQMIEVREFLGGIKKNGTLHGYQSGERAAAHFLDEFIETRLKNYATDRNDPSKNGLSGLSPYLHYGQLSSLQVLTKAKQALSDGPRLQEGFNALFEEMLVRKDLSDNFCYYNQNYDSLNGAPAWALASLDKHRHDPREHQYSREELEYARTHDEAWNAAQRQLTREGKIHGYMRMYWAKKVLEWSPSAQHAFDSLVYLNDFYHLDGRDPNGYVGILWSIAGLHDRPWRERPIFGSVRYMVQSGLTKKFDLGRYIAKYGA